MKRYLLDTNILVVYIRGGEEWEKIERELNLQDSGNLIMISVVTAGEILSLASKFGWGGGKRGKITQLLNRIIVLDINMKDEDLINTYADIDAYSQGKLPAKKLNMSARNMGKNDLWIAATAVVAEADLVTTDADFDHLDGSWLTVIKV